MQIEFTGGQWGFMVNTRVWLNDKDWSQSDGVAVFMNSTPHLPASECFTVSSAAHTLMIGVARFVDACLKRLYTSAGPPVGDQASDQLRVGWRRCRDSSFDACCLLTLPMPDCVFLSAWKGVPLLPLLHDAILHPMRTCTIPHFNAVSLLQVTTALLPPLLMTASSL